ncbi:Swt1 family HEPN domain-containing protein [Marinobacter halotolerans]|uniref:Swt1 family HEPN domain-containing protein n=1 Tax=Marinobacter halotolerans TaxID=1569211 RepID=UPI001246EA0E|nr:Swt1 family HEPN domain-containing protein [Marinobacter halotolerans]
MTDHIENRLRSFYFSCMAANGDLERLEESGQLRLVEKDHRVESSISDYFEESIFREANQMAQHYMTFYCLERSARNIVVGKLEAIHGGGWWASTVPPNIQTSVSQNMQRELDAGVTPRSENEINYTTFGELGEIVKANWADFGDIFKSPKAFTKIMTNLNVLRGPIAHCSPLSEDEVLRLELTVKDWIRLQST